MNQQPITPPPYQPQHSYAQPSQQSNAGKTLGIISIIMSFVGLALIGVVLAIISLVQAGKAGASKVFGIIGLILNIVALLVAAVLLFLIISAARHGVQELARSPDILTDVSTVAKKAEQYHAIENKYPTSVSDFSKHTDTDLKDVDSEVVDFSLSTESSYVKIQYNRCSDTGVQIIYYAPYRKIEALGDASPSKICDATTASGEVNSRKKANLVAAYLRDYYTKNESMPATITETTFADETSSKTHSVIVTSTPPTNESTVQYVRCSDTSGVVFYYDNATKTTHGISASGKLTISGGQEPSVESPCS